MKHKNEAAIIGAAMGWGVIGLFTRNLSAAGVSSGGVLIIRAVGITLFFALCLLLKGPRFFRIRLRDLGLFIAFGAVTLFFTYCYYGAIERVSMSVACTLMFSAPVFVTLLSIPIFREKFEWRKILALVLAMGGVVLVSGMLDGGVTFNASGALLGLLSGIGYAVYNILSKMLSQRGYNVWQLNFYGWGFCTLGALLIWGLAPAAPGVQDWNGLGLCAGMVLISGFLPALMYNWALAQTDASRASMMGTLEPVVATIAGALVFHEKLTLSGLFGIALVLDAVILLNIKLPKKNNASANNK